MIIAFIVCWFLAASAAVAQTPGRGLELRTLPPQLSEEIRKLTASDAGSPDEFGFSVAISGDTVVVGARFHNGVGGQSGAAYVFERDFGGADNWGEIRKLTATDAVVGDFFGQSVAISGDTIVVGAHLNDDACPANPGCESGSAYVFERDQGGANNWGEVKKLTASDAAGGDFFGIAVSISGDTIVIGASGDLIGGSAYVFERSLVGPLWGEAKKLTASDASSGAQFGGSLSLDADTLVVGTTQDNAAYLFGRDRDGVENWGEITRVMASDAPFRFGAPVALDGDTLVVGAARDDDACGVPVDCDTGAAYLFERDLGGAENWGERTKITASDAGFFARFGSSVAIRGDTVAVGAFLDNGNGLTDSGSAYLFERDLGGTDNWGELDKLNAADGAAGDEFGNAVSVDGGTLIVGAHLDQDVCCSSGAAYVFASPGPGGIFENGFESGDTSLWSQATNR